MLNTVSRHLWCCILQCFVVASVTNSRKMSFLSEFEDGDGIEKMIIYQLIKWYRWSINQVQGPGRASFQLQQCSGVWRKLSNLSHKHIM
jgi:hypothetical protein